MPETLTKNGFQGWEFSCEFTKVFQHNKNTWVGLMYCVDGGSIGVSNMLFVKENQTKIDVITQTEEGADEFERCEVKKTATGKKSRKAKATETKPAKKTAKAKTAAAKPEKKKTEK